MQKIVLASSSPYRMRQMQQLCLAFESVPPNLDEDHYKKMGLSPNDLVRTLARKKAQSIEQPGSDTIIIASDQVLCLDGEIFGKPHSKEIAIATLKRLSGKTHQLLTSLYVTCGENFKEHVDCSEITFRSLEEKEIERYVELDMPLDCAGSYKMESLGISLIEKINSSDPSSIQGLPLIKVCQFLRDFGVCVP